MNRILTGASRGIGRALALSLARRSSERLFLLARDARRLAELASAIGPSAVAVEADLSTARGAGAAAEHLAARLRPGAVLVHNAGIWPSRRVLVDGLEESFGTNCVAQLALQAPLLERGLLARVLVVSAGLLVKGRFDAERTPTGEDFSALRTYASTKLAGAIAMRAVARAHPEVDFAVVHPGVVRTELGARAGVLGAILRFVKRRWESPEPCAERLADLLAAERWSRSPGVAPWFDEAREASWPGAVDRDEAAVRSALARLGHRL